jgi:hypothetical protein
LHRHGERILNCLLGDFDVPEVSDQYGHCAAILLAEYMFDL